MPLGTGVPVLAVGSQLAHSERPRIIGQTLTAPAVIGETLSKGRVEVN